MIAMVLGAPSRSAALASGSRCRGVVPPGRGDRTGPMLKVRGAAMADKRSPFASAAAVLVDLVEVQIGLHGPQRHPPGGWLEQAQRPALIAAGVDLHAAPVLGDQHIA